MNNMRKFNTLMEMGHERYCGSEDYCYIGTCPINCLSMLFDKHKGSIIMTFGLIQVLRGLVKKH